MARIITDCSGLPTNDSERKAIALLRDRLSNDYLIIHNFEFRHNEEVFEIDLAILAPHAVYLVDIKGTQGLIDVYGSKWYPEGRQPFYSPLAKLRNHAKILASIIKDSNPGLTELRKVHVHASVLLTADNATLYDQAGIDSPDVTGIKNCLKYFTDQNRIPDHRHDNILKFRGHILKVISGKAKPKSSAMVFRDWQVEERLGGDDHYTEYRAKHSLLGKSAGMARLRIYIADPYQDESTRQEELKKISNAYHAVAHMPPHTNILAVKEFFITDEQDKIILVTEDVAGQALRQHINKASMALTFDQKLEIIRNILAALDHTHKHEVIHRNLTPDSIIVTKGGLARVTGFDFARVGKDRTSTIAHQIIDDLDENYQAFECFKDPTKASIASDLFSAGLIFYELITGEKPFENLDQLMELDCQFPIKPSEFKPDLPKGFDEWLQSFCMPEEEDRHSSAAVASDLLNKLIIPEAKNDSLYDEKKSAAIHFPEDLTNLQRDDILAERFRIQEKLGSGAFGVAYKAFDSLGDVVRVIKLVTRDRRSVYERLRREYKTLTQLPEHPNVVKVIWADRFNDTNQTPYIVFEYIEGLNVGDLIDTSALSIEDAIQIIYQATKGLIHLHQYGVYHQDIKPSNLLWTDQGIRIIDFNIAVSEKDKNQGGGGTRRYIPPDYDVTIEPSPEDRVDRDLYALGITFYECLSGGAYPFEEPTPQLKKLPREIKQFKNCNTLSSGLIQILNKLISSNRSNRYVSAKSLLEDFEELKGKYTTSFSTTDLPHPYKVPVTLDFKTSKPNFNPFVTYLLSLYSQSQYSNVGTRGLDEIGKALYVKTYLDEKLEPELLKRKFRLVIISGNAGDGKTAFIQKFESTAESKGAQIQRGNNGSVFQLKGHTFQSNYDGSQDEGDERNDDVLRKFFSPFKGENIDAWPTNQTRVIAINEGRLVDFFLEYEDEFKFLSKVITNDLKGEKTCKDVAVINLNLRTIVADTNNNEGSIFERLISSMTKKEYWVSCDKCDIKNKCYAYHNACTFQDSIAGPKIIERLKALYTITHLRGHLHITMRDLRSALAYMLVGTKDCDSIHQLYLNGGEDNWYKILNGYYFNSWVGGSTNNSDRLISLLKDIDIAQVSNPELDKEFNFLNPDSKNPSRFKFNERSDYDQELINILFKNLPRDYTAKNRSILINKHRNYVSVIRRKHFFECRDNTWKSMLPYKYFDNFYQIIKNSTNNKEEFLNKIIMAINNGEGIRNPERIGNQLALRVRKVDKGTIQSYRLFDRNKFILEGENNNQIQSFVEYMPQSLSLNYMFDDKNNASLKINLDIYEMLMHLNEGYRPSIEEEEGFYLSLSVFKNVLSSAPYQEVLLSESGYDFYKINRDNDGILHLDKAKRGAG